MNAIKKLLATTDFSDNARQSAVRAAMLAADLGAQTELLHVVSDSSPGDLRKLLGLNEEADTRARNEASLALKALTEDLAQQTGQAMTAQLRAGQVESEIQQASRDADMLLVGARGQGSLSDAILGSTTEKILRNCARPILVNKRPPQAPYQRVMVAMDLASESPAMLQLALQLAPGASVTIVHAFDVPFEGKLWVAGTSDADIQHYRNEARLHASETIRAIMARIDPEPNFPLVIAHGDPAQVIIEQQDALDPDLIIVSKRPRTAMGEMLLGSITRHILSCSRCDVLVVPE